jgi:hypothetical protein
MASYDARYSSFCITLVVREGKHGIYFWQQDPGTGENRLSLLTGDYLVKPTSVVSSLSPIFSLTLFG